MVKEKIPDEFIPWIDARKRFRLNDTQIQMARELGMNPKKFGALADHRQAPWKLPLPEYIAHLYYRQFKKYKPQHVRSLEQVIEERWRKKRARLAKKLQAKQDDAQKPELDAGVA